MIQLTMVTSSGGDNYFKTHTHTFIYLFDCVGLRCSTLDPWSSLWHVGSSSLTRDQTMAPALGAESLSHWTTREVLVTVTFKVFSNKLMWNGSTEHENNTVTHQLKMSRIQIRVLGHNFPSYCKTCLILCALSGCVFLAFLSFKRSLVCLLIASSVLSALNRNAHQKKIAC